MKRNSTYRRRRKSRSPLYRLAKTHPVVALAAMALIIFAAWQMTASERPYTAPVGSSEELMAVVTDSCLQEQIVRYPGFTVSFNADMHQPNYVAWELTADEAGASGQRDSKFDVDRSVKGTPELNDYSHSGFDRGHMIPAADVKWDAGAMKASHYLTNICPQDHKLNAGAWANLEGNCRTWAMRDSSIIIICGPVLSDHMPRKIGKDVKIPVPERFFKVVLSPYTNPPRGIGFIMANGPVEGGVQAAAVTIDQVEAVTGFDFFAALPDDIENEVEAQCEYHVWQRKNK